MAELGQLQSGLNVPLFRSTPLAPMAPPPDPSGLVNTGPISRAKANAALYGAITQTLQQLPQTVFGSYLEGKEIGNKIAADNTLAAVASGQTPNLPAGASVSPNGVTYTAPSPYAGALAQADLELKQAEAAKMKNSPFAVLDAQLRAQEAAGGGSASATPASGSLGDSGTVPGTVFGMVPSGRFDDQGNPIAIDDPQDAVDAAKKIPGFDPTKGAWGANIKDPSLVGVSLPVSSLVAAGVDPDKDPASQGYAAQITLPDGTTKTMPIVDKNGSNTVDFTYGAYRDVGGRQDVRGGDNIPNVSFKVIKPGQAPATPTGPTQADNTALSPGTSAAEGGLAALASGSLPSSPAISGAFSDTQPDQPTPAAVNAGSTSAFGSSAPTAQPAAQPSPVAPVAQAAAQHAKGAFAGSAQPIIERGPGGLGIIQHIPGNSEALLWLPGHDNPITIKDPNAKTPGYGSVDEMKQANPDSVITDWTQDAAGRYHPGKMVPNVHLSAQTVALAARAGYTPQPGETDATVQANSTKALENQNILTPDQVKARGELLKEMGADKDLQNAFQAKHALDNLNTALADPNNIDPFKVKTAMDAFNAIANNQKSMGPRLGKMMEQGAPTKDQLSMAADNIKNLFTGSNTGNQQQVLPAAQVAQLANVTRQLYAAHSDDIQNLLQDYRDEAQSLGLPSNQADRIFARYNRLVQPSENAPATAGAPATPSATPATAQAAATDVQSKAQTVLQKYQAGGYTGQDKARAEKLLRQAGLIQ